MSETTTIILSVLGINVTLFGALAALMVWMLSKVDADVKKIDTDMKGIGTRIDSLASRLDGHAMRIDQLYKMFVDLLAKK